MNEWTIRNALEWTEGYLTDKGDENPRLSAQWLLSDATGLSRTSLFMNYDRPLSSDERTVLHEYVARRGAGEPLQYITGEVAFRHIPLKVRPGVLIPRPETEVLVSEVLSFLPAPSKREAKWNVDAATQEREAIESIKQALAQAQESLPENRHEVSGAVRDSAISDKVAASAHPKKPEEDLEEVSDTEPAPPARHPQPLLVADLCTGSGCIACSLAFEHPDVRVIATDIDPHAVALAQENIDALNLGQRVAVIRCNLGDGIGTKRLGTFDAVVANPPYIPSALLREIPREVTDYEPVCALDGGSDGLACFVPLAQWALTALKPGGLLACELYEGHLDEAAAVAEALGFNILSLVDDLAGRPRVLLGQKPLDAER